MIMQRISV